MREQFDKVKQLCKSAAVDLHRNMLAVKDDAVLIVVYIRRVLESPFVSLDLDGDDPVVLSRRMVRPSGISFVLHAELTFRIGCGFCLSCRCNGLRILLGLG